MTRKRKCHSKSNSYVAAEKQAWYKDLLIQGITLRHEEAIGVSYRIIQCISYHIRNL